MKEIINTIKENSAIIVLAFSLLAIMAIILYLTVLSNKKLDLRQPSHTQWQTTTEASINYADTRLDTLEATQKQILVALPTLLKAIEAVGRSKPTNETTSDLKAIREMIATLQKDMVAIREVHSFYSANTDNRVAEVAISLNKIEKTLATHSGNSTIHNSE